MTKDFYRGFEERYRGSRQLIASRLDVYLPFILPLKQIYPVAPAIDLGCGRGEWLELLIKKGFLPQGVDLDDGMLQGCIDLNLPAVKGDIIDYLATVPNESQVVVSAFHVVEHISFNQLQTLVSESIRVLKPGGLLIMETPNPENIVVGTSGFYLDPTHIRPIPSLLLSFIAEYSEFKKVKTLRLQESAELKSKTQITLSDVINGTSPDYAIIAQKDAEEKILTSTKAAFDKDYGLSLNDLLNKWDTGFHSLINKLQQTECDIQLLTIITQELEVKHEKSLLAINTLNNEKLSIQHELMSVYASKSWKVTALFRYFSNVLKKWVNK